MKILFCIHSARAFRSTLIGHLHEITQVFPTVLISDGSDSEMEQILNDHSSFPLLQTIVPTGKITTSFTNLLWNNKRICRLAHQAVAEHKPDIVITASDMHSLLEMYLLRFSRKAGALNICVQPTLMVENKRSAIWVELMNIHTFRPAFLPKPLKRILVRIKKYVGHFFIHCFLPLLAGETPLFGASSYILRKGNSGMRDANFQLVFSSGDAELYRMDGVPDEKLFILPHPLQGKTRGFMKSLAAPSQVSPLRTATVLLLLPAEEIGFTSDGYTLIPPHKRWGNVKNVIKGIAANLDNWEIIIKPHPDFREIEKFRKLIMEISSRIKVAEPRSSLDKYIEQSDVIIELPRAASTASFTASLQCPEKPILALDFDKEFLGNVHKHTEGVEYIDSWNTFEETLTKIRNGCYEKKNLVAAVASERRFENIIEAIMKLSNKGAQ